MRERSWGGSCIDIAHLLSNGPRNAKKRAIAAFCLPMVSPIAPQRRYPAGGFAPY